MPELGNATGLAHAMACTSSTLLRTPGETGRGQGASTGTSPSFLFYEGTRASVLRDAQQRPCVYTHLFTHSSAHLHCSFLAELAARSHAPMLDQGLKKRPRRPGHRRVTFAYCLTAVERVPVAVAGTWLAVIRAHGRRGNARDNRVLQAGT
jgi:hypothetical protein